MGVTVETLYEAWERELAQLKRDPDAALIAALEWRAHELGYDLCELHKGMVASAVAAVMAAVTPPPDGEGVDWEGMATDEEDGITDDDLKDLPHGDGSLTASGLLARIAVWDPDLHPRGHDGKFIETLGFIKVVGGLDKGNHGQVVDITPDPNEPGKPIIHYRQTDARGNQIGPRLGVKPNDVEAIDLKARLDKPIKPGPRRTDMDVDLGPDTSMSPYKPLNIDANKYAPKNSTLTPEQATAAAEQVMADQDVSVNDVDVDDVISNFLNSPDSVDLTRMSQFSTMRESGRPRSEMPQIPKEHLEEFKTALDGEGVSYEAHFVDPRTLTATQSELDGKSVAELIASTRAGTFDPFTKPVWISSDNKVLDGHHRWAAAAALAMDGSEVEFPVIRVDMPMDELLDFADEFNANTGIARRDFGEIQNRTYVPPEPNVPDVPEANVPDVPETPEGDVGLPEVSPPPEVHDPPPLSEMSRAQLVQFQRDREDLTAWINAEAEKLSTTSAEDRYDQLDQIFKNLRFSPIDTDKVHDHIYKGGHGHWTEERDAVHEEMWDDFLNSVKQNGIPQNREALALGGLPGAGKSSALNRGEHGEQLGVVAWEPGKPVPPDATHVSVNPDIVKEMMIERGMLPEGLSDALKPREAVNFIHEESSHIANMFAQRLSDEGYNIVLDNTMNSAPSMQRRMDPLARNGYSFKALFADIPIEESKKSARKRYLDDAFTDLGGRFVPPSVSGNATSSKGSLSKNRDAFDQLVQDDWFLDYMVIDNTGISDGKPKKEIITQGTGNGSAVDKLLNPPPLPPPEPVAAPGEGVPPGEVPVVPAGEAPAAPAAAPVL